MKQVTRYESKTIKASNAAEFDRLFAEASKSIDADVELRWDYEPMCVHFVYKYIEQVPETVAEEYELQGIKYYCTDCPYLQKGHDGRYKSKGCKYSKYGAVKDYTPACELFYKELMTGKIKVKE